VLIRTAHRDRREIDVQPARGHAEPLDRARRDPGAEILRVDGERLKRPAEPVIVQQRGRDPEQLVDTLDAMAAATFSNVSEEVLCVLLSHWLSLTCYRARIFL